MKKLLRCFTFAVSFCLLLTTGAMAAIQLPGREQVDAAMKRTLGYDPAVVWQIVDIRQSAIPGVTDAIVSINKQASQHIYLSPDGQNAIIGEMIPFGTNPFAPARAKLSAADGPGRGAANPVIQIVEFSELECKHCKAAQPILNKLAADFPQVRFIFQQFPLPANMHPWAMKAALYTDCAGQDKDAYWRYIDAIFENQDSITPATVEDKLKVLANGAGLDAVRLAACAASPDTEARVQKSLKLGQSMDLASVPTVFINGRRVLAIADIPYSSLKDLVQFEIDHAGR